MCYFMPDFSGDAEMNLMKTTTWVNIALLLVFSGSRTLAQQEPQFTHNVFTRMAINPAFAGSSGDISVTGLMRQQWVGFKDMDGEKVAPQTYLLTADMPVRLVHGGLGISITSDRLGFENNTGIRLNYAYRTSAWDGELAVGPVIGFLNKSIDFSKFKPTQSGDPILGTAQESTMMMDVGLGVFYEIKNKYFIGISTSQLIQTGSSIGVDATNYNLKRHYYAHAGYLYTLPDNPLVKLQPTLFVKTDFVSTQFDINLSAIYNDRFWGGITYRLQDAIAFLIGLNYKSFIFGYSYDLTTSQLGSAGSSGSHEIFLNYRFKLELDKNPRSYRNTRYL
ncbi:MAG TPA: type IX secretion system membrane protein PorP/SprF [Bacteroidales bacterium]|nr:type IX secretion system membrane protein PorP/SprF [Bacteroidales bacterium]